MWVSRTAAVLMILLDLVSPRLLAAGPDADEVRLLDLLNAERKARRLSQLSWEPTLARLARDHAADMARAGKASHHSTGDGADFAERLRRTDLAVRALAENVAVDRDVASAHRSLMASPGHRENILNPDLTAVGIGIVAAGEAASVYVAEDFAAPLPIMSGEKAAARLRDALAAARSAGGTSPLEEDASLSRRLSTVVETLAAADSVEADTDVLAGPGWIFCYTTHDPAEIPDKVRKALPRARSYGIGVTFGRTPSYPFGTWWVVVAMNGP
jgi:uncharacterized protein YkwD